MQLASIEESAPTESALGQWHPAIRHIHEYWQSIHPVAGLPGRQHFDPVAIPELLSSLWILDVHSDPFRLRYRLIGTDVVEANRRDMTGCWVDEAHPHLCDDPVFFERYRRVVTTGRPSWRRGTPRLVLGQDYRTVENIVLPLAADGSTVDMLLCLSRFRLDDDGEPCVVGLPRMGC